MAIPAARIFEPAGLMQKIAISLIYPPTLFLPYTICQIFLFLCVKKCGNLSLFLGLNGTIHQSSLKFDVSYLHSWLSRDHF